MAAVLCLAGGCASAVPALFPPAPGERTKPVWLVQHGWHTRLVVRDADVDPGMWPERTALGEAAYREVGWGDAAFYPAANPGVLMALNAALLPTPAVLYVGGLDRPPGELFPDRRVVRVELSAAGFARVIRFIEHAYARDAIGEVTPAAPGWSPRSAFYRATGRYHLLHTSNVWTARALREGGAPVSPAWAITAGAVMGQAARAAGEADR